MELIYNHRIGKLRDASIRLAKIADDSKDDETRVEFEIYSWAVFWAMHKLRESSMCIQPTDEAIEAKAKEMCEADPTNREATKCGAGGYYDWTTYKMRANELLFRESEKQGQEVDSEFHRFHAAVKARPRKESPVSVEGEGKLEYIKGNLTPEKIEEMIEMSNAMTALLEANYFKTHESPFTITTEKS